MVKRRVHSVWLLAALLASTAVGASSQAGAQSHEGRVDPCSLLTDDDAERITDIPMKRKPTANAINCSYMQLTSDSGPTAEVHLNVMQHRTNEVEDVAWGAAKNGASTAGKLEVVGSIGDEAYVVRPQQSGIGGATLFVRKGTADFMLTTFGSKADPFEAMKEIAKKIADQL